MSGLVWLNLVRRRTAPKLSALKVSLCEGEGFMTANGLTVEVRVIRITAVLDVSCGMLSFSW